MTTAVAPFVSYWSRLSAEIAPYLHPDDASWVRQGELELNLLPIPVNGNLIDAEAVVLTLNPGLDGEDYSWEERADFRNTLLDNLRQTHGTSEYPLNYLAPNFGMHAGAGYWSHSRGLGAGSRDAQKLRDVIEAVAKRDKVSIDVARAHVSRKVAILQLCPYHSASKPTKRLLRDLPSCNQARALVKGLRADGEKLIVATRSVRDWGLGGPVNTDRLVVYAASQGTAASLSLVSAGGQAILRRLSSVA